MTAKEEAQLVTLADQLREDGVLGGTCVPEELEPTLKRLSAMFDEEIAGWQFSQPGLERTALGNLKGGATLIVVPVGVSKTTLSFVSAVKRANVVKHVEWKDTERTVYRARGDFHLTAAEENAENLHCLICWTHNPPRKYTAQKRAREIDPADDGNSKKPRID